VTSPATEFPAISTPRTTAEVPFFFESADRPLYGVFHPAAIDRAGAPVVVHCHSLGVELLTNYRNDVMAARAAARLGVPALRHHARGHGDSAGDFVDVTFETLVEDALAAAAEARRRAGAGRVIWLGTRLGALVAAEAARRAPGSAGLALWEPVHAPADYVRGTLRGVLFSRVARGERPEETVDDMIARLERDGRVDVHGYFLHRPLVRSLDGRDLSAALEHWSGPTLLVQIQRRPRLAAPHAALAATLERRGARVTAALVHEEPGWQFVSNPAWQSAELVRLTAEWLDAVA